MYKYMILGAAALVAASPAPAPAPQAFDTNLIAAIPATMTKGPPVGIGPTAVSSVYNPSAALSLATASVVPTTAAAKAKRDLDARNLCMFGYCYGTISKPSITIPITSVVTTAPPTSIPTYLVPTTCTPVSWTNTFAFTSDTACPTPFEVGTFCGFINPNDPCAPQVVNNLPVLAQENVTAFQNNPVYHQSALTAKTPVNYTNTFRDLNASVNANSYLGFKTLPFYDVAGCASYCDNTDLCTGFNIFVERDPLFNPDQCSCTNPPGMGQFKCSIWGSGVQKEAATNFGQSRDDFQVVIVASNGYEQGISSLPTPPGTSNPQDCGKKLHNFPKHCLGQQNFPGPFDPSVCALYAAQQNTVNKKAGLISFILSFFGISPGKCVQFQAAEIEKDGAGWGTHCRLFTSRYQSSQANLALTGQYTCGKSFTWDI